MIEGTDGPGVKPAVWKWFVVYCVVMVTMYLVVVAMGLVLLVVNPERLEMEAALARWMGVFYLLLGLVLAGGFAVGPFLPRRPWAWIYGIVLIAVGMTSCCVLPASIPLLIYWLKPEAKAWFGRSES